MLLWASCLGLALCVLTTMAAPFNLRKDPEKTMKQLKEQLQKINDIPGIDNEEYLRYWKEAVKNDPSMEQSAIIFGFYYFLKFGKIL